MSWVKLDDQFFSHPKAREAGRDGCLLYLAGLTYCARYLTDGWIPRSALPVIAAESFVKPSVAAKLVRVGLWLEDFERYVVNDYLEYNPTRADVEDRRQRRSEAGAKGAASRWHGSGDSKCHADTNGDGHDHVHAPVPSPSPQSSIDDFLVAQSALRSSRGSRIPDGFEVDEAMADWAETECPLVEPIMRETQQFYDYWKAASGKTAVKLDWGRAWKVWMRKAQIDAERRQRGSRQAELRR